MVASGGVNAVFGAYDFPELGTDLVAALPALNVKDFAHFFFSVSRESDGKVAAKRGFEVKLRDTVERVRGEVGNAVFIVEA